MWNNQIQLTLKFYVNEIHICLDKDSIIFFNGILVVFIYTTYNEGMTFSPKNLDVQKNMQRLQHFKAKYFHNYNKQSIVYNKNKHESKSRPKLQRIPIHQNYK